MTYESFISAQNFFLWSGFILAFIIGAVANKTNFCTMGAISDMVNIGDWSRFRAWLLTIAVAITGVVILESAGMVDAQGAFPPYRNSELIWAENILGGLLFGIGMTLGSGCGNKTLVRIGGGNLKSVMVFLLIATIAYFMVNPFPGSDQTLMSLLFYDWIRPLAISLKSSQDIGAIISVENALTIRLVAGGVLAAALFVYIFKSAEFRATRDNIISGIVIGLAIVCAWYVTSNVRVDLGGEQYSLQSYAQEWDFLAESEAGKPEDTRPLAPQSYTFINPMAQTMDYTLSGFDRAVLSFGVMAALGVVAGSLFWSLISKNFRLEWFANGRDFLSHFVGGILMGFGGTLALGCTIGQAVTGISTLAIGSFLTFFAIVFGAAMTMKIQLYKMVYEDASVFSSFVTGLADMKLLPSGMRKHDPV